MGRKVTGWIMDCGIRDGRKRMRGLIRTEQKAEGASPDSPETAEHQANDDDDDEDEELIKRSVENGSRSAAENSPNSGEEFLFLLFF